jgi:hypothetical protein
MAKLCDPNSGGISIARLMSPTLFIATCEAPGYIPALAIELNNQSANAFL